MIKNLIWSIKKDYITTLLFNIIVILGMFLIYKIVIIKYGATALSDYGVIKRYMSFLIVIVLGGTAVTVPKYLSQNEEKNTYHTAVLFVGLLTLLSIFFSYIANEAFFNAVKIMLIPVFASLLYSYYRGISRYVASGFINIIFLVFLQLFLLYLANTFDSYIDYNFYIGLILILALTLYSITRYKKDNFSLSNSLLRVPGDLSFQGLYFLPVFLLNNSGSEELLKISGMVAISFSMINAFTIPINPISTILLVKLQCEKVKKQFEINKYLIFLLLVSALGTAVYYALTPFISMYYFNTDLFREVLYGMGPLVFFISIQIGVRGVIDSVYDIPLNSLINFFSLLILFVLVKIIKMDMVLSLVVSFAVMSLISVLILKRKLSE